MAFETSLVGVTGSRFEDVEGSSFATGVLLKLLGGFSLAAAGVVTQEGFVLVGATPIDNGWLIDDVAGRGFCEEDAPPDQVEGFLSIVVAGRLVTPADQSNGFFSAEVDGAVSGVVAAAFNEIDFLSGTGAGVVGSDGLGAMMGAFKGLFPENTWVE